MLPFYPQKEREGEGEGKGEGIEGVREQGRRREGEKEGRREESWRGGLRDTLVPVATRAPVSPVFFPPQPPAIAPLPLLLDSGPCTPDHSGEGCSPRSGEQEVEVPCEHRCQGGEGLGTSPAPFLHKQSLDVFSSSRHGNARTLCVGT